MGRKINGAEIRCVSGSLENALPENPPLRILKGGVLSRTICFLADGRPATLPRSNTVQRTIQEDGRGTHGMNSSQRCCSSAAAPYADSSSCALPA